MLPESLEKLRDMRRINACQRHKITQYRIEVGFNDYVHSVVEKRARFSQITRHFFFEIRFLFCKLGGKPIEVFVKKESLRIATEIDRIQRVELHELKRYFNATLFGKLSEFVRHTEKAWPCVESESIFFDLIQPATCLMVSFEHFNFISFFC